MKIPEQTITWLLESEIPHVRYNAAKLFSDNEPSMELLLSDNLVNLNLGILAGWDSEILKRHDAPGLLIHRLALLADLGIRADNPEISPVIAEIMNNTNEYGIPEILMEIPTHFGGSGNPERLWLICDFPTILYALLKMGVMSKSVERAVQALEELVSENGYRCVGALPKFKGPGSKTSMCPYANLISAKALSEDNRAVKGTAAETAVESLLGHWEARKEKKYFLFGIGTDFRKLKYPFVWYNILHMLEVISRFPKYHADPRFIEMMETVLEKRDDQFRFKPESMYMIYKGHDFADKKNYSPTITLCVMRILKKIGMI